MRVGQPFPGGCRTCAVSRGSRAARGRAAAAGSAAVVYTTRRRRVPGVWQRLPVVQCADKPKRSLLDEPVPLDQPNMQHRLLRAVGVFYPSQGPTGGARGCPYPLAHLKLLRRPRREVGFFYASEAPAGRPRGTRARGNTVLRRVGDEQTLYGAQTRAVNCAAAERLRAAQAARSPRGTC